MPPTLTNYFRQSYHTAHAPHTPQVERSKKRLSLSLKPSYFKDDPDSSDSEGSDSDGDQESGDDEDDGGDGSGGQKLLKAVSAMDVSDDEDDQAETDEEQDDDDDDDGDGDDNDSEEEEDDSDEEEENENEEDWRSSKRPRSVLEEGLGGGGVTGKGANAFSLDFGSLGSMGGAGASSDEDEDSDDESDGDNGGGDGNGWVIRRTKPTIFVCSTDCIFFSANFVLCNQIYSIQLLAVLLRSLQKP